MTNTGHRIVLAARPKGAPQPSDFRHETFTIPQPSQGQVLLAVRYLSLDPYMRGRMDARKSYAAPVEIGAVMEGGVVAQVMHSQHPDYQAGEHVLAHSGWCTHALSDGSDLIKLDARFQPLSTALGVLGMPGLTAYAGLLNIGQPKPGETVVVAAASGPVGSLVGQIARIKGARVVGIAGGVAKCAYVKDELGFDAVVDHRAPDFAAQLAAVCPNGIDVYFELVGGAVWQAVCPLLNEFARVPVCGLIAQYNAVGPAQGADRLPATMAQVLSRSLTLRGFIVREFAHQRAQFLDDVGGWIASGRVRFREDRVQGLANAPQALIGLLEGKNFGKVVVQIDAGE